MAYRLSEYNLNFRKEYYSLYAALRVVQRMVRGESAVEVYAATGEPYKSPTLIAWSVGAFRAEDCIDAFNQTMEHYKTRNVYLYVMNGSRTFVLEYIA